MAACKGYTKATLNPVFGADQHLEQFETEAVEPIFLAEDNQVGEEAGESLWKRVAHMCDSLEDATKHVELRNDLMEHILRRH